MADYTELNQPMLLALLALPFAWHDFTLHFYLAGSPGA